MSNDATILGLGYGSCKQTSMLLCLSEALHVSALLPHNFRPEPIHFATQVLCMLDVQAVQLDIVSAFGEQLGPKLLFYTSF